MFNKSGSNDGGANETALGERQRSNRTLPSNAVVGASVHVDGRISGEEDLLIEGKVTGTVEFKNNTVTVGSKGHVMADLYGRHLILEGKVEGNVFAAEAIVVRKSAHVTGRLVAPAVSLEQGGFFSGTVEMDKETKELKASFGQGQKVAAGKTAEAESSVAPLLQSTKSS